MVTFCSSNCTSVGFPCRAVIPAIVFIFSVLQRANMNLVEKFPRVAIISGWMIFICSIRNGVCEAISSGLGSRLFGGRYLRMLAM